MDTTYYLTVWKLPFNFLLVHPKEREKALINIKVILSQ